MLPKLAQVTAYQQQTEWSCSAATLKAAAAHFGVELTEPEVIKAVGARKGRGAETDEIVAGAKKLGFDSWEKSFKDLDEAKEMLKRGIPIIADFQSFNHPGKGHYVLIVGFKPGKGFILMDPNTKGKTAVDNWRILSEAEMEEKWWDRAMAPPHKLMPKWGVMIMPKQKEKTASPYGNALNRAKAESRAAQGARDDFGKYSDGDKDPNVVGGALTTAAGAGLATGVGARSRVAGYKRVYHGTASDKNVAKIKQEGLQASRGGSGAAGISKKYVRNSKGKVHVSGVHGVASLFTADPGTLKSSQRGSHADVKELRGQILSRRKSHVLKADLPMKQWEKFQQDPDFSLPKGSVGKHVAATTTDNVPSNLIHGGKGFSHTQNLKSRAKALPGYVAKHPGRFATGVGMMGGGALLARKGVQMMKGTEKVANGDMLDYFQKNPQKYKEYLERKKAKEGRKTKEANDPIKEKKKIQGVNIHLEWLVGEERTYFNHDPLKKNSKGELDYKTKMKASYGYVPKRWDADGEDLDVYLGPNEESTKVFVIKQIRPSDGSFDEHKIMIGYDSIEEAQKSYLAHMPKKFLGSIRATTMEAFKKEFLMGKAKFEKKSFDKAVTLGALGGAALGYGATKSIRNSQDERKQKKHKAIPAAGALLGAMSGADIGKFTGAHLKHRGTPLAGASARYLRNPMIAGAVLGGGLSAAGAAFNKKRQGKDYKGGPTWASGAVGALHGAALGGHFGQIGAVSHDARNRARQSQAGASGGYSARQAPPSSQSAPDWAKGAKTQKEVKQRMREMARKHHSDLGAKTDDVMKKVNVEYGNFQNSSKFKGMPKEAALRAFADELRLIMEGNAVR